MAKQWGNKVFWGVGYDYDPQWTLDDKQLQIQAKLIQMCKTTLRQNAVYCDETYSYPRENLKALASMNLLGLLVPKELGGLGQSHQCASMVVETIARYGCPSTAMVYVMHLGAVATLLFRYHNNKEIQNLLRRLDKDVQVGTLSYSDPATGGHYWYSLSSKSSELPDGRYKVLKYASWTTSAGFADWYAVQTMSPNFSGDYSNMSVFLMYADEVRGFPEEWKSLGMHGNQSGPLICEGVLDPIRMVGPMGDGAKSNDEAVDPFFLLLSAACWNGIAMACLDLAKKHVTEKRHADSGMRVVDYPTIQESISECLMYANSCRLMVSGIGQALDKATNNNDWSIHKDLDVMPRFSQLHWCWQVKFQAAKMLTEVADKMLFVCGGAGFKTDLGLERLIRDSRAAWVMGPSNEVLRQWVGIGSLFGGSDGCPDYWHQNVNERILNSEVKKMTVQQKQVLAQKLMEDIKLDESNYEGENEYQGTEFDNPFNVCKPATVGTLTDGKTTHKPALSPDVLTTVKLSSRKQLTKDVVEMKFKLADPLAHTGCMPGQYLQVQVGDQGKGIARYVSPVSPPTDYGSITITMKLETMGQFSKALEKLEEGSAVQVLGPCGGFEYKPNQLSCISFITSAVGITPAIQLIRTILNNPDDKTNIRLVHYAQTEEEILYKAELDAFQKSSKQFRAFYTLGEPSNTWEGGEGYVDKAMIEAVLPERNLPKQKIIICGGSLMAITTLDYLKELGHKSENIYLYGTFGVVQLRAIYGRRSKLSVHNV